MLTNLIQREREASKEFMFDTYPDSELVVLSRRNVALAEAMIANNSTYMPKRRAKGGPPRGSVDDDIAELCQVLLGQRKASNAEYSELVARVVNGIDRANSTRLNADHVGRKVMHDRIVGFGRERLVESLRFPDNTNYELFRTLEHRTKESVGGRTNPSFASKFCHHMCLALFEGEDEQDNYSVYDSVVSGWLGRYIEYFGLEASVPTRARNKPFDYPGYRDCVDAVIGRARDPISRTGFDRLVWYYFKGRTWRMDDRDPSGLRSSGCFD